MNMLEFDDAGALGEFSFSRDAVGSDDDQTRVDASERFDVGRPCAARKLESARSVYAALIPREAIEMRALFVVSDEESGDSWLGLVRQQSRAFTHARKNVRRRRHRERGARRMRRARTRERDHQCDDSEKRVSRARGQRYHHESVPARAHRRACIGGHVDVREMREPERQRAYAARVSAAYDEDLSAILRGDDAMARTFLALVQHPADITEALRYLEPAEWPRVLSLIDDIEARSEVVATFDDHEREQLFEHLDNAAIGSLIREMESDDAADVIGELEPADRSAALNELPLEERRAVEELLSYPDDSAGGIMQLERAQVRQDARISDAIERVRELADAGFAVHRVYVVDEDEKLIGSVDIVALVLHRPEMKISELVEPPVATVTPLVDQEVVADMFRKYDLVSIPVVDDSGRLIGRILFDDVQDVVHEEAEEDVLRMAGTDMEELLYRDQPIRIAFVRLPWIGINLFGSLISAFLLHLYEPVIVQAIILAAFIPVITAMGGNVGTQSATILTRGLATGRIDMSDLPRTLWRELRVGLLMGVTCGAIVGIIATLFFSGGRGMLGVVVALAMVSAMTTAAVVGTVAPAAMKRFGIDPAIASGPFVTTANDIIGIVIYMSSAMLFLDLLIAP
jgi:magnesium transporter